LIEHQAFLCGGREDDMKGYLRRMDDILALCAEFGTVPYLLVLPHCAQVSEGQKRNMAALGAEFSSEWSTSPDYPFLNRIAGHTQGRATVLNPLPAFQAAEATGKQLYFNNDPHLNAAGQEMLGEWVRVGDPRHGIAQGSQRNVAGKRLPIIPPKAAIPRWSHPVRPRLAVTGYCRGA
jgi:hypothetical protein